MPQTITVDGIDYEFPESMKDEEIKSALVRNGVIKAGPKIPGFKGTMGVPIVPIGTSSVLSSPITPSSPLIPQSGANLAPLGGEMISEGGPVAIGATAGSAFGPVGTAVGGMTGEIIKQLIRRAIAKGQGIPQSEAPGVPHTLREQAVQMAGAGLSSIPQGFGLSAALKYPGVAASERFGAQIPDFLRPKPPSTPLEAVPPVPLSPSGKIPSQFESVAGQAKEVAEAMPKVQEAPPRSTVARVLATKREEQVAAIREPEKAAWEKVHKIWNDPKNTVELAPEEVYLSPEDPRWKLPTDALGGVDKTRGVQIIKSPVDITNIVNDSDIQKRATDLASALQPVRRQYQPVLSMLDKLRGTKVMGASDLHEVTSTLGELAKAEDPAIASKAQSLAAALRNPMDEALKTATAQLPYQGDVASAALNEGRYWTTKRHDVFERGGPVGTEANQVRKAILSGRIEDLAKEGNWAQVQNLVQQVGPEQLPLVKAHILGVMKNRTPTSPTAFGSSFASLDPEMLKLFNPEEVQSVGRETLERIIKRGNPSDYFKLSDDARQLIFGDKRGTIDDMMNHAVNELGKEPKKQLLSWLNLWMYRNFGFGIHVGTSGKKIAETILGK